MATHGRGLICAPMRPNASTSSASRRWSRTHRPARHRLPRRRRPSGGHHDRHLGRRPRRDHPRAGRPRAPRRRPHPPRPHLPAGCATRRGARARRAHRGGCGPCPAGRPAAGRRPLRDRHRRRHAWPACPTCVAFAAEHGLLVVAITDLIAYRRRREHWSSASRGAHAPERRRLHARSAIATCSTARAPRARARRRRERRRGVLVRVHSECLTGDVFGSRRCDCGAQLERALADDRRRRPRASSSTSAATRGGASACTTSCTPTGCRTAASTPSTPTSSSGCPATGATTASACRSSPISASDRCGC